jgi:hypothetical protein
MLTRVTGPHLEDGLTDDVTHISRHYCRDEPAAALLKQVGVPTIDISTEVTPVNMGIGQTVDRNWAPNDL